MRADDLIKRFELEPHPEGGFFKRTYQSPTEIEKSCLPNGFGGSRPISTAIYFLLPAGARSLLHRIRSDELWHFYLGGPMAVVEIDATGALKKTVLGSDILRDQTVQHVVPAGTWFGAYPLPGTDFSFVGCTVAPGFDFADFELGRREELVARYPNARDEILNLTV